MSFCLACPRRAITVRRPIATNPRRVGMPLGGKAVVNRTNEEGSRRATQKLPTAQRDDGITRAEREAARCEARNALGTATLRRFDGCARRLWNNNRRVFQRQQWSKAGLVRATAEPQYDLVSPASPTFKLGRLRRNAVEAARAAAQKSQEMTRKEFCIMLLTYACR